MVGSFVIYKLDQMSIAIPKNDFHMFTSLIVTLT